MRLLYLVLVLLFPLLLIAQNRAENQDQFQLHIQKATAAITVDGQLQEPDWQSAEIARNFWMKWPRDNQHARSRTEVRMTYDDKFLYVSAMCFDSTPQYIIQNLKRDVGFFDSDGFSVVLDPANKATNGYFFGVNAAGSQSEGLVATNNNEDQDMTWDNRWFAEITHQSDGWSVEMAIPFQIIRFDGAVTEWGINFIRNDLSNGEWDTWTKMPLQFNGNDLGFTGKLLWDAAPRRAKGNYNLSPYATASVSRDYEEGETAYKTKPNAGLDAKIGVGSSLNLDLTVNPDFSQVEIDEQVINLTRFNIQLPEKRTFFLENGDIFGNFGIPPIRPFFSRRIGIDDDGRQIPILAGARLSGNLDPYTRIGVMTMQTGSKYGQPGENFSAVALHRRLFGRTSTSGYFLNRQAFDGSTAIKGDFSRNAGAEFSFTSNDGKWSAWSSNHVSMKPGSPNHNWWLDGGFGYSTRKFDFIVDMAHMGENFYTDQGFEFRIQNYDAERDTTLRIGYDFIFTNGTLRFMPKHADRSRLNFTNLRYEAFTVFNPNGTLNEESANVSYGFNFKNTSWLSFKAYYSWANVPVSFKFDDKETEECPALPTGIYEYGYGGINWFSDSRKRFIVEAELTAGQFYNGSQAGLSAGLRYRAQPWGNFAVKIQYNKLDFPAPYCDVELFNITPRIELFFNRNLNWTTFIQYNTQADNFNINSRIQWRYRPMSDVFLVYTDNYGVQAPGVKNRAVVLKVNYWL